MTEQDINYQFGVIREFIEHALYVNAAPYRTEAIATTIIRLENLHDKMLELVRKPAGEPVAHASLRDRIARKAA